jgi:membrane-bound lytic murein transglycosylase D
MKRFWAFALLLLAGGCVSTSPGAGLSPVSPQPPAKASASHQAQAPGPEQAVTTPGPADETDLSLTPSEPYTLADLAPPDDADGSALFDDQEPADPETLEDNQVLSGKDQTPPDDEGVTVPAKEVTFDFPVVENEKVHYFINYFSGPAKRTFSRWLERSGRYLPMMKEIFAKEGLPRDLAYLSMIESGFNDRAYSWANAAGLWQFIESTGKIYGLDNDWWQDERRDPLKATRAAARHLADLKRQFDGNWYLAVAAYNAGPGKIQRAVSRYHSRDFWKISRGRYLRKETKRYVPKLLAALMIAKEPAKYGFTDLNYQKPLEFDVVKVPTATDLEVVAKSCGVTYQEIKKLNPELKRWCTPPGAKDYSVRIPAGTKDEFQKKYALVPESKRANYRRHRVKHGDTLLALAHRYHIRVRDIISLNRIKNPKALRIGTNLILPLHGGLSRQPLAELGDDYLHSRRATYKVKRGDSLWKIAQRFNVTEKQLRVWNRLGWSNLLHPGQTLVVSAHAARRTVLARRRNYRHHRVAYRVRPGDSLWKIARRFNVSEKQIKAWNHLGGSSLLHPGQTLALYAPTAKRTVLARKKTRQMHKVAYRVRPGDSLWEIARRFDVSEKQIKAWNHLGGSSLIHPGQTLALYTPSAGRTVLARKGTREVHKIVYQVRPGDTLWDIGRRFDVATHQIMAWNNLSENDVLQPGDDITLLVPSGNQG